MIKVVIADDEIRVCQLISHLIQWDTLAMECVAIVHDGISALDVIRLHQPDIVITDIRMPGYDGIELIQKAKEMDASIKFVIISGYSNFEYTQSAIRYEASDYILKPIKKDELNRTLHKIKTTIEEERIQLVKTKQSSEQSVMRLEFVQNSILNDLWTGSFNINTFNHYFTKFEFERFFVIQMDGYFSQERCLQVKLWFENMITQMDKGNEYEVLMVLHHQTLIGWITMSERGATKIDLDFKYLMTHIRSQINLKSNEEISLAAGMIIHQHLKLEESIVFCRHQLYQRWANEDQNCFIERLETLPRSYDLQRIFDENQHQLMTLIDALYIEGIEILFDDLSREVLSIAVNYGYEFYLWLNTLADTIQASFLPNRSIVYEIDQFKVETMREIETSRTFKQAYEIIRRNTLNMAKVVLAGKLSLESKPIRQAKRYIEMHYQQEISLDSLAQEFGLSAPYFSTLFKRETGQKFIDYLTVVRIEKSKDLLRDSALNISEICIEIGYNDQKHFTTQFKKITGLKPSEYRKIYA